MEACRFLVARRIEADGSVAEEPNVVVDWLGAGRGEAVMVSTDGDIARAKFGNNTPVRLVVAGIVDVAQEPGVPNERSSSLERKEPVAQGSAA